MNRGSGYRLILLDEEADASKFVCLFQSNLGVCLQVLRCLFCSNLFQASFLSVDLEFKVLK